MVGIERRVPSSDEPGWRIGDISADKSEAVQPFAIRAEASWIARVAGLVVCVAVVCTIVSIGEAPAQSIPFARTSPQDTTRIAQADTGNGISATTSVEELFKRGTEAEARKDDINAARFFQAAADRGYAPAQLWVGRYHQNREDYSRAVPWLRKAAEQGDPTAQTFLGINYTLGQGVAKNHGTALGWLRKAADQDSTVAQFALGEMHRGGMGTPVDYGQAMQWHQKAAAKGFAKSQYRIGIFYKDGLGVPKDDRTAVDWLLKSANQGYAPAQSKIGWYYYDGHFLKRDLAKAFDWFNKGAQQSDPADGGMAEGMLGAMYQTGQGALLDHAQAMKWLLKSAEHSNSQSMFELGLIYEKGAGEAPDFGKAVTWYQKASEAGNANAKQRLATLQARSQTTQQAKSAVPDALHTRCFLEVDVDALKANASGEEIQRRHNECLRSNWKRLFGAKPFPEGL